MFWASVCLMNIEGTICYRACKFNILHVLCERIFTKLLVNVIAVSESLVSLIQMKPLSLDSPLSLSVPPVQHHLTKKKARPHSPHRATSSLLHLRLPPTVSLVAQGITDGRSSCSPLPGLAKRHSVQRGPSGTWVLRCRGVGHDGELTSNRGTVDDGHISFPRLSEENKED